MASRTPPIKNLADLKQVQRTLAETREREAAAAAARAAAERKRTDRKSVV